MAGIKGRSGRKTNFVLKQRKEIKELSEYILIDALQSPDVSKQDKIKISLALYPHYIPNKQDISIAVMPSQDKLVLDKYSIALPPNRLDVVAGIGTGNGIENKSSPESKSGDGGGGGLLGVPPPTTGL